MPSDFRLFFGEFRRTYRTTGAIAPSGRRLAGALARYVGESAGDRPRRILEVGPGTGSVTQSIIARMGPKDSLDLVELNARFADRLRERLKTDAHFQPAAARTRVLQQPVESLDRSASYDLIVSGLPLNNFEVAEVQQILAVMTDLLKPGGTLSFFQYIGIRPIKAIICGRSQRRRLRRIGRTLAGLLAEGEVRRDWIWPNLPPAWVHHLRPDRAVKQDASDGRSTA